MIFKNSKKGGFTLIELLFAIFIFSIVIGLVYGAYRTTFHIIQGSELTLNESHKARAAFERISEDLMAIVTGPGGYLQGGEQDVGGNRGDSFSFVSSTHIALNKDDLINGDTIIRYSSELNETDNTIQFMRSDSLKRPQSSDENSIVTKYLLCSGLKEVRLTYYNDNGEESTEWETESDSENGDELAAPELPAMVEIELIFPKAGSDENGSAFKTAVALKRIIEE
jgi:prepilin-type N-terminal cleavage/methylation domain-containing protein